MDEIEKFIKAARTTLGANGSKFITYHEFLIAYRKDNGSKDFETEARSAGYSNGREALFYYSSIFQFKGDMVRRADLENISHIVTAVDNSKSKKKPARRPICLNANYGRQPAYRPQPTAYRPQPTAYRPQPSFKPQPYRPEPSYKASSNWGAEPSNGYNRKPYGYDQRQNGYGNGFDQRQNGYAAGPSNGYRGEFDQRQNGYRNESDQRQNGYGYNNQARGYNDYEQDNSYNRSSIQNCGYNNKSHNSGQYDYKDSSYDRPSSSKQNHGYDDYEQADEQVDDYQQADAYEQANDCEQVDDYQQADDYQQDVYEEEDQDSYASEVKATTSSNAPTLPPQRTPEIVVNQPPPTAFSDVHEEATEIPASSAEETSNDDSNIAEQSNFEQTVAKFEERTLSKVMEEVGERVFKMIKDVYAQGLSKFLRPDSLNEIIKKHQLDSNFSLHILKCFLSLYFSSSFHITAGKDDAFSVKSKPELSPKNELLKSLLPQNSEQQIELGKLCSCQLLTADYKDQTILIGLSRNSWKQSYEQLVAELRRYASMIAFLRPLDYVFKSNRVLYFDKQTRKFYRCLVVSAKSQNTVEVFLLDELQRSEVDIGDLYKMPSRFYHYQDMTFVFKIDNKVSPEKAVGMVERLRKCIIRDHVMEIIPRRSDGYCDGVPTYTGSFEKVIQSK